MPKPKRPPHPESIGPYRIEEQLGAGGMGAVYRAFHEPLARPVALKQILPEINPSPELRERFVREARAAAQLSHPSIVQVHDILQHPEGDWIVMELAEGETLSNLLEVGPLDIPRVLAIAQDVAAGLAAAHAQGIVHRDLKAENVVITPAGRAKILDFGLAKLRDTEEEIDSPSVDGQLVGTPRAMSPEQAVGDPLDHRSDLFSFGTLLYEMLTGISPFRSPSGFVQTLARVCVHQQPPARKENARVPRELSDLIDRLLQKEPRHRPQSAEGVVVALQRLSGTHESPVRILFVDDEPDYERLIRQKYRKKIRAQEIFPIFAIDGMEALKSLKDDPEIALVVTDIRMPRMSGLELLDEIGRLDRQVVTIIVSAYGDMGNIRTAMNRGAFDFLTKPIDFEDLEITRQKCMAEVVEIRKRQRLQEENRLLDERNRFIRDALSRYLQGDTLTRSVLVDALLDPQAIGKEREVTVLKASLEGFEDLPRRLSAEDLVSVLSSFFETLVAVVRKYDGALFDCRRGDLLIVFGHSLPRESDASRAVDCALELRLALESVRNRSVERGGPGLALKVGVDSGQVRFDLDSERGGYEIVGLPVHRASRIESQSSAGQILLSEETVELCRRDVSASERIRLEETLYVHDVDDSSVQMPEEGPLATD